MRFCGNYIIQIRENNTAKYLFNARMLVHDPRLAKIFSSPLLANRYLKKSNFRNSEHTVLTIKAESIAI